MAETILTSDKPSTSSQIVPVTKIICHVCQKQFSQYTCPRCNSRYCSLPCYKAHSLRCTESFMRENVMEELQQMQPDDETKQKMLDILKRFQSEEGMDSMEEDDSTLSEETIQKISSGHRISLDDLSHEEKKQFHRAIASGELSKMIEPWDPWWLKPSARKIFLSHDGVQLIQPVHKQETEIPAPGLEGSQLSDIPPGPEMPLPPLSNLLSTEPSPLLAFHLIDIIYSYCFALRLYNGDWKSDALGAAMVVLSVSAVLGVGGQPETLSEALSYCLEQICSPAYRHAGGLAFGLGLINDIETILTLGGDALVCLLCDLQRLILAGERDLKSEKPRKLRRSEIRTKLRHADRKIYFMMCWVHEQPREAWSSLATVVGVEKRSMIALDNGGSKPVKADDAKGECKGKILIQEIP